MSEQNKKLKYFFWIIEVIYKNSNKTQISLNNSKSIFQNKMVKLVIVSEQQMWDSYSPSQKMTGLSVRMMNKMNSFDLFAMLPAELGEKIADIHEDVHERERLEKHKTYGDLAQEKRLWVLVRKTTKKDLKAICKGYGIKGHSGRLNSELAEMIAAWEFLGVKVEPLGCKHTYDDSVSQDRFNLHERVRGYFPHRAWKPDRERNIRETYLRGTKEFFAEYPSCPKSVKKYTGSKLWDGKAW